MDSIPLDIDIVGETVQFLGTIFLLQGTSGIAEEDKKALLAKCREWKRVFRGTGRVAEAASERVTALLTTKRCVTTVVCVIGETQLDHVRVVPVVFLVVSIW